MEQLMRAVLHGSDMGQLQKELVEACSWGEEARARALVSKLAEQPRKASSLLEAMSMTPRERCAASSRPKERSPYLAFRYSSRAATAVSGKSLKTPSTPSWKNCRYSLDGSLS